MIRDASQLEQIGSQQVFRVQCQALPGKPYPQPNAQSDGYVLPVVYVADAWPFNEAPTKSARTDLMWSISWHSPGFVMEAVRLGEKLYAIPKQERYNVRVYEADGTIRWTADWLAGSVSIIGAPAGTVTLRVAVTGGRIYVTGPHTGGVDGSYWSLIIYDEMTGQVIRKVETIMNRASFPPKPTGVLDIAVDAVPPDYTGATELLLLGVRNTQVLMRHDLDGEFVSEEQAAYAATGPNDFLAGHHTYDGSAQLGWGLPNAGLHWIGIFDNPITFAQSGNLLRGRNTLGAGADDSGVSFTNHDDTNVDLRFSYLWRSWRTQIATVPYLPTDPRGMTGDAAGDAYLCHPVITRLIGGTIHGTTGTSATGTVSRWDASGNCLWLRKSSNDGHANQANTIALLTDGDLVVGSLSQVMRLDTAGDKVWTHDHFTPNDCEPLPDGASVFVGSRHLVDDDTSFV